MFCPEDGTLIPPDRYDGDTTHYSPCTECSAAWVYDGAAGSYAVDRFAGTPGLELIPTLQAVGLNIITECPVHPGSDHDLFDCPPDDGPVGYVVEPEPSCSYCGQYHIEGSCLEPADFE